MVHENIGKGAWEEWYPTLAHWLPTIEMIVAMMSAARYVVSELKDALSDDSELREMKEIWKVLDRIEQAIEGLDR